MALYWGSHILNGHTLGNVELACGHVVSRVVPAHAVLRDYGDSVSSKTNRRKEFGGCEELSKK